MAVRKNEARWIESRQRWQINVQKDGERRTFVSTTAGKKGKIEAEKKADAWLVSGIKDERARFASVYEDFLQETRLLTSESNYIQKRQLGTSWLLPRLKHKRVAAITCQDWQNCINDAYKAGKSKKTLQNVRGCATAFYKYVKKRRIPMERPEDITIPDGAAVAVRRILQPDDLRVLFTDDTTTMRGHSAPDWYIYAYRFCVLSGLRRGELIGLRHEDVAGGVVHVVRSVNSLGEITRGKTKNAVRKFLLTEQEGAVLEDQRRMLREHGVLSPWVFPDEQGERSDPNILYKRWRAYSGKHGIQCSFHELRHTFVSIVKDAVPDALLKSVIGHSKSMDTQGIYGHEVTGDMEKLAVALDARFADVLQKK